ncbi:MAG: hypothetical protein AAF212_11770 [Verrucomicrobiota bacterium]
MSQQTNDHPENQSEVEEVIDSLLAKQVVPSEDFTSRVVNQARESKYVVGPWSRTHKWMSGVLTAAAAVAIAVGLSIVYTPHSGTTDITFESESETNPFLLDYQDPEFVDETPLNSIESLLDSPDSLPSIDPLFEKPLLIDINILLES